MENCIRQLRKDRGLTLSDLAARCEPPTTAQTIGRLETGMRTLSLDWLDRIAQALDISPNRLLAPDEGAEAAYLTARLDRKGVAAFQKKQEIHLPRFHSHVRIISVEESVGEFASGDLLWFEALAPDRLKEAVNRIVLLPGRVGRFHIGRLATVTAGEARLLPLSPNGKVETVSGYAWASQLRKLVRNFD